MKTVAGNLHAQLFCMPGNSQGKLRLLTKRSSKTIKFCILSLDPRWRDYDHKEKQDQSRRDNKDLLQTTNLPKQADRTTA